MADLGPRATQAVQRRIAAPKPSPSRAVESIKASSRAADRTKPASLEDQLKAEFAKRGDIYTPTLEPEVGFSGVVEPPLLPEATSQADEGEQPVYLPGNLAAFRAPIAAGERLGSASRRRAASLRDWFMNLEAPDPQAIAEIGKDVK